MRKLTDSFHVNPQVGKTAAQITRELREVAAETSKRKANGLDTEDQDYRAKFLRDARGQVN